MAKMLIYKCFDCNKWFKKLHLDSRNQAGCPYCRCKAIEFNYNEEDLQKERLKNGDA